MLLVSYLKTLCLKYIITLFKFQPNCIKVTSMDRVSCPWTGCVHRCDVHGCDKTTIFYNLEHVLLSLWYESWKTNFLHLILWTDWIILLSYLIIWNLYVPQMWWVDLSLLQTSTKNFTWNHTYHKACFCFCITEQNGCLSVDSSTNTVWCCDLEDFIGTLFSVHRRDLFRWLQVLNLQLNKYDNYVQI